MRKQIPLFHYVLLTFAIQLGNVQVTLGEYEAAEYNLNVVNPVLRATGSDNSAKEADNGIPLIVGGVEARAHEFPWTVTLNYVNGRSFFCGGSIYSAWWIITAAHCIVQEKVTLKPSDLVIIAGEHRRSSSNRRQVRTVSELKVHKDYSKITLANDIALIKLSQPLYFNSSTNSIALNTNKNRPSDWETVIVAGWGLTVEGGSSTSDVLRKVNLTTVPQTTCRSQYNNSATVTANMLCASGPGKDSCQGDSGGPLMCITNGQPSLCGIVSFGIGCARPNYPGVYTRVSSYIDWINKTAQSTGCYSVTSSFLVSTISVFMILNL